MKDKILQISLAQFLKYGIRKMSIQKLIAPLNISTKTFYKHFKNKEELLENALQLFYSQQYVMLKNLDAKQSAACLFFDIWHGAFELEYEASKEFFHDLHHYYPDLGKRIDKKNSKTFWNKLIQILHRGIEEGAFRKDIIPEAVLEGMGVLFLAIVREEKFKKYGLATFEILLNSITPSLRGICTAEGLKEMDEHISSYQRVEKIKT